MFEGLMWGNALQISSWTWTNFKSILLNRVMSEIGTYTAVSESDFATVIFHAGGSAVIRVQRP